MEQTNLDRHREARVLPLDGGAGNELGEPASVRKTPNLLRLGCALAGPRSDQEWQLTRAERGEPCIRVVKAIHEKQRVFRKVVYEARRNHKLAFAVGREDRVRDDVGEHAEHQDGSYLREP